MASPKQKVPVKLWMAREEPLFPNLYFKTFGNDGYTWAIRHLTGSTYLGEAIHAAVYTPKTSVDIFHHKQIRGDFWHVLRCICHPSNFNDRE